MIKATKIILNRAEGSIRDCGQVTVQGENIWEQAAGVLRRWRYNAPGPGQGYHKCDLTVKFADGFEFKDRVDITNYDYVTAESHLQNLINSHAKNKKPEAWTEEQFQNYLKRDWVQGLIKLAKKLENYQIGDV